MATLTSNSLDNCNSIPGFMPTGTRMSFSSSGAPPSWTKESSLNNNRALRVTTGTATPFGSGTVFSTVFPATNKPIAGSINAANSTDTFNQETVSVATLGAFNPFPLMNAQPATIGTPQIGQHNHTYQIRTAQVNTIAPSPAPGSPSVNAIRSQLESVATGNSPTPALSPAFSHTHTLINSAESHSHTVSVTAHGHTVSSLGPHSHQFTTTAQNFNIKYVDTIVCIKS